MTGQEMVTYLRENILDDAVVPYSWTDAELLRNLNYAEVQACRRGHLIIDATTVDDNGTAATAGTLGQKPLCVLSIIANRAVYNLSPKILQVRRIQLMSMSYALPGPKMYPEVDELLYDWWGTAGTLGTSGTYSTAGTSGTVSVSGTGGHPDFWLNEPGNTITFVRAPSQNDVAALIVSRIPLTPFTLTTSPEIEEKYHEGLMDWAAHLAFRKPMEKTINLNLAKYYEDQFIAQFGQLPDAYRERMVRTLAQNQRMRPRVFGS